MYVGGLGAAAGGNTSLVGSVPAVVDIPPLRAPHQSDNAGTRTASGAARGRPSAPSGGGPGQPVRRRRSPGALFAVDAVAVAVAAAGAYLLRFGAVAADGAVDDLVGAAALPIAWIATALANGAYDRRFLGAGTTEFRRLGRTFVTLFPVVGFVSYAAGLDLARGFVLMALVAAAAFTAAGRLLLRRRLVRRRVHGAALDRVVVVGRAASLPGLVDALRRDPAAGLAVLGACVPEDEADDAALRHALAGLGVPVLGSLREVRDVAVRHGADSVAVVAGDVSGATIRSIAWAIEGLGADLIVSSGLAEVAGQRVQVQSVGGAPLLRVDPPRFTGLRHYVKSGFDRSLAFTGLVVLSPLLLLLAALVRFTSRGPALYLQERVGRNGSTFRMVKFRSMYVDADERRAELLDQSIAEGPLFKMREDPRVTGVGKWLRRFSLDELPQLFNVLGGSMSLVGPRPPLPSEVARYEADVHRRLLVKPGLTGLWQVSGRSDLSWEDSVRLDLHYVDNWSLALDLRLLARTVKAVVRPTGAY